MLNRKKEREREKKRKRLIKLSSTRLFGVQQIKKNRVLSMKKGKLTMLV